MYLRLIQVQLLSVDKLLRQTLQNKSKLKLLTKDEKLYFSVALKRELQCAKLISH